MKITTCRASREERKQPLPGDSIISEPMQTITHAVTIEAPPEAVWPWLAQMGGGRAGWYSYDRIDNGGRPSSRSIVPELQDVKVGDIFPAVPGATDAFVAATVEPARDLVLMIPNPQDGPIGSWEFFLEPLGRSRTRLLVRVRVASAWPTSLGEEKPASAPRLIERIYGLLAKMPRPIMQGIGVFGHRVMEARMLRGIKRRAERAYPQVAQDRDARHAM